MIHQLCRTLSVLTFVAGAAATILVVMAPRAAVAQTLENRHQQRKSDKTHVHAEGSGHVEGRGFVDHYLPAPDISTEGKRIDWLFNYTTLVSFIFFMIMAVTLFYFGFAFRERPGHKAEYSKGKSFWEQFIKWGLDAAVFISLDLVLIYATYKDTAEYFWKIPSGPNVVKVMVMPQQWAWNFKYAGADGQFNTEDDINTINEMRIPRGQPIVVQMKAKDIIHGFLFMESRIQMDAIPGSVTRFWFDANKTGDYELTCAHFCGTFHYKMKGFIRVMEPEDFTKWIAEMSEWSKATFDPEEKTARWGWKWEI